MKISGWHVRAGVGAVSLVLVGFVLGVAVDRVWLAHVNEPTVIAATAPLDADHSAMVAFRQVLELDDDQVAAIHEILMRNQVQVDLAWESIRAEVTGSVEDAHAEIRELLTEEQVALFEAWVARHVREARSDDHNPIWRH